MKKTAIAAIAIIILSFIIGIYLYPQMPERMASHWNSQGEVDGFMPKFWGLFLFPIIMSALMLLFLAIPKIDPLKKNIKKFRKYYDIFILLFIIFFTYIYILTLIWNIGYRYDMTMVIIPALAILFYYLGILNENAKRNWFIGLRTPWTLSSEKVWNKTHKLAGKLFKLAAIIALLGLFIQKYAVWLIIGPILAFALYLVVYSYIEYQKEKRH